MGVQLFSSHLCFLERDEGSSWLSGMESGIVCSVSRLSAFEAKSLLHIFSSFLSGHVVDVHGIRVFGWIEIKLSRILSSLFVCVTASCVLGVDCPPRVLVLAIALRMRMKLFWSLMAHLYQSSRSVGCSGNLRISLCRAWGSVSQKYLITASFFVSFDWFTNILNLATCSSMEVDPTSISLIA